MFGYGKFDYGKRSFYLRSSSVLLRVFKPVAHSLLWVHFDLSSVSVMSKRLHSRQLNPLESWLTHRKWLVDKATN